MGTADGKGPPLQVLAVDDEVPALDELVWNLGQIDGIGEITATSSSEQALELLVARSFDVAFLDIEMGSVDGLSIAKAVGSLANAPAVVFVTAYERHAVDAFELRAVDYLLKPVRLERVRDAVARVVELRRGPSGPAVRDDAASRRRVAIEMGGRTVFLDRDDVVAVEASRDYVRLHTSERSHLVRIPISTLETEWAAFGFVRVHRSFLVAVDRVTELRTDISQGSSLRIGALEIPVSRTYVRAIRDELRGRRRAGGS